MSCEQLSEQLPDYWTGRLTGEARRTFEAHLATCPACRAEADALTATWNALGALAEDETRTDAREVLPSPAMRGRFDAMLRAWTEESGTPRGAMAVPPIAASTGHIAAGYAQAGHYAQAGNVVTMPTRDAKRAGWSRVVRPAMQMAAALLCIAAGFAGGRVFPASQPRTEIADLRQELRDMRQMMTLTLLQQQSASERLRGVSWSAQVDRPGGPVLDALLDTLAHDSNVNVRLASIEALTTFAQDARVRRGLVDALAPQRQDSPLVQLALIDALVEMKEQRSVDAMKTLAADTHVNESVRRRATWGAEALGRL